MIDEHGRPQCDQCGAFVPVQRIMLPSGEILEPQDAARILCKRCARERGAKKNLKGGE